MKRINLEQKSQLFTIIEFKHNSAFCRLQFTNEINLKISDYAATFMHAVKTYITYFSDKRRKYTLEVIEE